MMIMRFHKLIQSKLLWLFFLGILITTFVGWGVATNTRSDQAAARLNRTVATIDGQKVSFRNLDITRRMVENQSRQRIPEEQLTDMALTHLAMVHYAEKTGLDVPEDMARQQFAMNFTDKDGKADTAMLQRFRASLQGSHLSEADYIRFTQEGIMLQNLQRMLTSYILIPGFDVDQWAGSQSDSYTVQFAAITPEILDKEVEISDEETQSFFKENIDRFQIPEKRKVRYLAVQSDDFADKIEAVSDSDARDAYMKQPELYVRSVSKPAEEEGGKATTVQEPIPFDEIKDQIMQTLRSERALKMAEETAMSYAVRMTPRRGRPGKTLDTLAEESGLEIQAPEAFSLRDPLTSLPDAAAFKQAVFKLDMTDLGKQGGPVTAGDAFVVMELTEILPPRPPEFSEVADDVKQAAQAYYTRKAVEKKSGEVVESIRKTVAAGGDFEAELKKYDLNMVSPPAFEMRNLNPKRPMLPPELLEQVTSAKSGDVIGPVNSRFGVIFVSYLVSRTPQPEEAAKLTPDVRHMLSSQMHFPEIFSRFRELKIEPMIKKVESETKKKDAETEDAADAAA